MKKSCFVILLCLACGLLSCTQTESSTSTKELDQHEIAEAIHNNRGLHSQSLKIY